MIPLLIAHAVHAAGPHGKTAAPLLAAHAALPVHAAAVPGHMQHAAPVLAGSTGPAAAPLLAAHAVLPHAALHLH
jgi:hypothetical protein